MNCKHLWFYILLGIVTLFVVRADNPLLIIVLLIVLGFVGPFVLMIVWKLVDEFVTGLREMFR
jgi:hypothetical protein